MMDKRVGNVEKVLEHSEVFFELGDGEVVHFNMTLPLQMLFDDVMTFVSRTDI